MKKIFILSSLIVTTLATPSFAEPTELDKKTVASKAYVDTKQDKITTGLVEWAGEDDDYSLPALVVYDGNLTGNKFGIYMDNERDYYRNLEDYYNMSYSEEEIGNLIPNMYSVSRSLADKQYKISKSGYVGSSTPLQGADWLRNGIKGTGLVTKTANYGDVGERKIFEATDVANYHATGLTQIQQDVQDISIPTVGAMMGMISNAVDKLTWTATETTATKEYSTTFDGTANNWPAVDANKLVDGTALSNGLAQKQNKMTCAGWDSETHTDEHCWLWSIE